MGRFENEVALVTGAAAGIGRATAEALAREGAKVVVADRLSTKAQEVVESIRGSGGTALAIEVDVRDEDAIKNMMAKTAELGQLSIAVNNAGIGGIVAPFADYPRREWDLVIAVNLTGVWLCMQQQIRAMLPAATGTIVNVASMGGLKGFPKCSAYAASKHGVIGLTRSAALEYARKGLRINAVCPGFTETEMVEKLREDSAYRDRLERMIPMGRLGTTAEIAGAILYLCSPEASFMNGHALSIDGGMNAQ